MIISPVLFWKDLSLWSEETTTVPSENPTQTATLSWSPHRHSQEQAKWKRSLTVTLDLGNTTKESSALDKENVNSFLSIFRGMQTIQQHKEDTDWHLLFSSPNPSQIIYRSASRTNNPTGRDINWEWNPGCLGRWQELNCLSHQHYSSGSSIRGKLESWARVGTPT